MAPRPQPIPLGRLDTYLDKQKRAAAAYPAPTIVRRVRVAQPDPVDVWRRGGGGGTGTGTYANSPPQSTDTKYRGIKVPKIAGSEGGFWGLISGLAFLCLVTGLLLWYFLRRRRLARARANGPSSGLPSNQSATTHNSFTSLASIFRNPFARRNTAAADATAASKRGWLHGSSNDWNTLGDEDDLVAGGGSGGGRRGRPGESMELYNSVPRTNPEGGAGGFASPDISRGGSNHPYGSYAGAGGAGDSSAGLQAYASTSTVRLQSPAAAGDGLLPGTPTGHERDPFVDTPGGEEGGFFTPMGEAGEERQLGGGGNDGGRAELRQERTLSGRFKENDEATVHERSPKGSDAGRG